MKKPLFPLGFFLMPLGGCTKQNEDIPIIGSADGPTAIVVSDSGGLIGLVLLLALVFLFLLRLFRRRK